MHAFHHRQTLVARYGAADGDLLVVLCFAREAVTGTLPWKLERGRVLLDSTAPEWGGPGRGDAAGILDLRNEVNLPARSALLLQCVS